MKLKTLIAGAACSIAALAVAWAQAPAETVKIGFITDLSSVYADIDGSGGVEAVRMAVADFGGVLNGKKIEVLYADHLNKADVAATKAREWMDQQNIAMLLGGSNSGAGLAMAKVAAEKKKPYFVVGAATSRLTNEDCSPYTVHYAYDTVSLAKGTGKAVVDAGGKDWFFLTADYAFGASLEKDTSDIIKASGGKVVGSTKFPLNASDFSSFLLQAQSSGAKILGLASAGGDTVNAIKAGNEFGINKTMSFAGLLVFINDINALGLELTQGMYLTTGWYWDLNDETRAWAKRYNEKMKKMPSMLQAADYSATMAYLNAAKAIGSEDADKIMAYVKANKITDMFAKDGYVRADGRYVHDMYLVRVKKPSESKQTWDYYNVQKVIKGEDAFFTKAESKCELWK